MADRWLGLVLKSKKFQQYPSHRAHIVVDLITSSTTTSLIAVMMDAGTTVDSKLCGLANTKLCSRQTILQIAIYLQNFTHSRILLTCWSSIIMIDATRHQQYALPPLIG